MTWMDDQDDPILSDDRPWIGCILGLWLTGVFVASLFGTAEGRKNHLYEAIMLISLLWPAIYFVFSRYRFVPTGFSSGTIIGLTLFGLFCGFSSFISRAPLESTQYTVLTILTILVVLQFNTNLDAAQYEIGLKCYAVLAAALVCGFALYDYVPGRRLGGGKEILNPASFALITMSVFVSSMAIRQAFVRVSIIVAMGAVIYLTGSRASAVAALMGMGITLFLRRRITRTDGYVVLFLCIVLGCSVAAYYGDAVFRGVSDFFAIQDRHRGLESGGSGRLETWKATWNLFVTHPILGVGFRAHEALLKVNTSAHNGYLALLAEIGVIGFAATAFLTFSGLWNIWRRNQDPSQTFSHSVLLGLACGYFVLAIFERYFINAGNPTSLLFLLSVLAPAYVHDGWESEEVVGEDDLLDTQVYHADFTDDGLSKGRA